MKKTLKLMVIISLVSCFIISAFAVLGSVNATGAFYGVQRTGYVALEASGSAEETIASPDDTMNLYAKTVIADPDSYILVQDEVTEHYVDKVYTSCDVTVDNSDLIVGSYYSSTFAAARYTDDRTSNDVATPKGKQFLWDVRSITAPEHSSESDYVHISLEQLSGDSVTTKSINVPQNVLVEIYGLHFMQAGVGDRIPQVYLKTDGSSCYIIDENKTNGIIKTYYNINGNEYSRAS